MESKVFRRNRVVSLLLALCMALTLLPGTARAEENGDLQPANLEIQLKNNPNYSYGINKVRENETSIYLNLECKTTGLSFNQDGAKKAENWEIYYNSNTEKLTVTPTCNDTSSVFLEINPKETFGNCKNGDTITITPKPAVFSGAADGGIPERLTIKLENVFPAPENVRYILNNGVPQAIQWELPTEGTQPGEFWLSLSDVNATITNDTSDALKIEDASGKKVYTYTLGSDWTAKISALEAGKSVMSYVRCLASETQKTEWTNQGKGFSWVTSNTGWWTKPAGQTPDPDPVTPTLSSIAVTTPPTKTSYQVNETFDKTGMVVTATYSDGSTAAVADYTLSIGNNAFTTAGETTITVTYEGKTTNFNVTVTESTGSETPNPTITATATRSNGIVTAVVTVTGATFEPTAGKNKENWHIALTRVIELTSVELSADGTKATLVFPLEESLSQVIIGVQSAALTGVTGSYGVRCEVDISDSSSGGTDTPVDPNPPVIPDIPFTPITPSTGNSGNSGSTTTKPSTPGADTADTTDGSATTTKTDAATGTVTETTKGTDGSETVVETRTDGTVTTTATDAAGNKTATTANPDGSSVTTIANKDGGASTTTVSASGQVTASVTAPAAAVEAAQTSGQAVSLPMPEVPLTTDASAAPTVTIATGSGQPVKVEIPVEKTTPGTVAVIVKADGTEEVVKTSLATESGVTLAVSDGATVKIVDNSKSFADTAAHWAGDAITFAVAHELFNGTGADSFTPNGTMTRGMMVTVLARYDGVDTSAGATWYEKGVEWAAANGISSGVDLDTPVSREQLAAMLYRYAAASGLDTAASGALTGFADAGSVSDYAAEAMAWAVGAGLIGGTDKGELNPTGSATRAEVAAILMRFCENVMK